MEREKKSLGSLEGGYGGGEIFFGFLRGGRWRRTKRVFPEGGEKFFLPGDQKREKKHFP